MLWCGWCVPITLFLLPSSIHSCLLHACLHLAICQHPLSIITDTDHCNGIHLVPRLFPLAVFFMLPVVSEMQCTIPTCLLLRGEGGRLLPLRISCMLSYILTYAYICTENNHLQLLATCVTKN